MMKAHNKADVDLFSVNMKILLTWFENVALKGNISKSGQ